MGASGFMEFGFGTDPRKVFEKLVEEARYEYGHGGYTGTIAEKGGNSLIEIPLKEMVRKDRVKYVDQLMDNEDERCTDKWGSVGYINLKGSIYETNYRKRNGLKKKKGNLYVFFGYASD